VAWVVDGTPGRRVVDVGEPPHVVLVRRIKGRVTWVRVARMLGGKVSVSIESNLDPGGPFCIDTGGRVGRRVLESITIAGLVSGLAAAIAALAGFRLDWVIPLAIMGTLAQMAFEAFRRSMRERTVSREGCEAGPGPLLRLVVEEAVRDALRAYEAASKKWFATIAGLPYEASAYRGKLGYVVTYKRLSGAAALPKPPAPESGKG
jgi:hypothetical protein